MKDSAKPIIFQKRGGGECDHLCRYCLFAQWADRFFTFMAHCRNSQTVCEVLEIRNCIAARWYLLHALPLASIFFYFYACRENHYLVADGLDRFWLSSSSDLLSQLTRFLPYLFFSRGWGDGASLCFAGQCANGWRGFSV